MLSGREAIGTAQFMKFTYLIEWPDEPESPLAALPVALSPGRAGAGPEAATPPLLFCNPAVFSSGDTGFEFLADDWRCWPTHVVLLVTDGSIPQAMPGDKACC